jgi:hypothetical protein
MNTTNATDDLLVRSFLELRTYIGLLAMTMPFVLVFGKILLGSPGMLQSVSGYYYSNMHDYMVGCMCSTGSFLIFYKGYDKKDNLITTLAGLCYIGIALFPTQPPLPTPLQNIIGNIHYLLATALFLMFAYISIFLFTKSSPGSQMTAKKIQRNRIYKVCGYTIIVCIIVLMSFTLLPKNPTLQVMNPVLIFEALASIAFGISWWVKGEAILADTKID